MNIIDKINNWYENKSNSFKFIIFIIYVSLLVSTLYINQYLFLILLIISMLLTIFKIDKNATEEKRNMR